MRINIRREKKRRDFNEEIHKQLFFFNTSNIIYIATITYILDNHMHRRKRIRKVENTNFKNSYS
jgi:hypothetical protein